MEAVSMAAAAMDTGHKASSTAPQQNTHGNTQPEYQGYTQQPYGQ